MTETNRHNQPYSPAGSLIKSVIRKTIWALGGFLILMVFAAGFFLAPEYAFMAAGLSGFTLFAWYEARQRRLWEQAADFKFHHIVKTQNEFSDRMGRQQHSFDALKATIEKREAERRELQKQAEKRGKRAQNDNRGAFDLSRIPRAIKPQLNKASKGIKSYNTLKQAHSKASKNPKQSSPQELSPYVLQEMVDTALKNKQLDMFMQPIVTLPQRKVMGYELFSRLRARAGLYAPAQKYIHFARQNNVIQHFDAIALETLLDSIRSVSQPLPNIRFFINIDQQSLKNKAFMQKFLAFVSTNRGMAKHFVFELSAQSFRQLDYGCLEIMRGLGRLGCAFSLDRCLPDMFPLHLLARNAIRYIKIHRHDLSMMMQSPDFTARFQSLKASYAAQHIHIIADHIETEDEMKTLLDLDLTFGQGFLFGKPDLKGTFSPFAHSKTFARRKGLQEEVA